MNAYWLSTLSNADQIAIYGAIVAIIVVFLGVLLSFIIARRNKKHNTSPLQQIKGNRLSLIEVLPIDEKRALLLIRLDNKEHLLLAGGDTDLLIESVDLSSPEVDLGKIKQREEKFTTRNIDTPVVENNLEEKIIAALNDVDKNNDNSIMAVSSETNPNAASETNTDKIPSAKHNVIPKSQNQNLDSKQVQNQYQDKQYLMETDPQISSVDNKVKNTIADDISTDKEALSHKETEQNHFVTNVISDKNLDNSFANDKTFNSANFKESHTANSGEKNHLAADDKKTSKSQVITGNTVKNAPWENENTNKAKIRDNQQSAEKPKDQLNLEKRDSSQELYYRNADSEIRPKNTARNGFNEIRKAMQEANRSAPDKYESTNSFIVIGEEQQKNKKISFPKGNISQKANAIKKTEIKSETSAPDLGGSESAYPAYLGYSFAPIQGTNNLKKGHETSKIEKEQDSPSPHKLKNNDAEDYGNKNSYFSKFRNNSSDRDELSLDPQTAWRRSPRDLGVENFQKPTSEKLTQQQQEEKVHRAFNFTNKDLSKDFKNLRSAEENDFDKILQDELLKVSDNSPSSETSKKH